MTRPVVQHALEGGFRLSNQICPFVGTIAFGFPLNLLLYHKNQSRSSSRCPSTRIDLQKSNEGYRWCAENFWIPRISNGHDLVSYRAPVVGEHSVSSCHSQALHSLEMPPIVVCCHSRFLAPRDVHSRTCPPDCGCGLPSHSNLILPSYVPMKIRATFLFIFLALDLSIGFSTSCWDQLRIAGA